MRYITIVICFIFCFSLSHCSHSTVSVEDVSSADTIDIVEDLDSGDLPLDDSGADTTAEEGDAEADCGDSSPADQEPVGC